MADTYYDGTPITDPQEEADVSTKICSRCGEEYTSRNSDFVCPDCLGYDPDVCYG